MSSPAPLTVIRRALGSSAIALALALAGCSSSDADPTAPGGGDAPAGSLPDPCSFLTAADVEAVSGVPSQEGEYNDITSNATQAVCDYHPVEGVFPLIEVYVAPDASSVASQRESAEDMMGASVDVTVPGASNAYTILDGSILGMAVGDYFVQVSYMTSDLDDVTALTIALASEVAAGL